MKTIKKRVSAILAAAMAAGSLAANTVSLSASAMLNTSNYTINQFDQEWNSLIQQEKQKFPEKKNGKQCYWNGGNEDGYTTSPCGHGWDGAGVGCNRVIFTVYDSATYKIIDERDNHNQAMPYMQCAGFAVKLQQDIFGGATIIRLKTDNNGHYTALNGKTVSYTFKKGDSVRFNGHSIFITGVNGNNITFAQCNADGHCAIDWDATSYKGTTITADYLKAHLAYIDRPMMTGDLNLDGVINSQDATIFANTVKSNGTNIGNAPYAAYDMNYDNIVNNTDYSRIQNMSGSAMNSVRYVNTHLRSVNPIWTNYTIWDSTFKTSDGNIYSTKNNTTGGVTFYGNYDSTKKTVTIPSSVKNPTNNQTYTVTELGYYGGREPGCKLLYNIENLTLPTTIKKINQYAFWNCALKTISIPNNSQLTTVENYAFMHAEQLTYVAFPPSLETIGKQAFGYCKKLSAVRMEPVSGTNDGHFRLLGDNAFTHCPELWQVSIANNLTRRISIGETTNVFDADNETVWLHLVNTSSVAGIIDFKGDNDVQKWSNITLRIECGNYRFYDKNGKLRANHPSTAIGCVYPN